MSSNLSIADICSKIYSGGTPSTSNKSFYDGGTIPWLKTKEINFNKIYKTETTITDSGLKNSSAKIVPVNSIIVAMYGETAGKIAINKIPLATNQACCNLVIDSKKANLRFVYFYLLSIYRELLSMRVGGAQQNLSATIIKALPFPRFSLSKQDKIAEILGSIEDLIETAQHQNTTLEAIAQRLFRSWFVNFDPVHAKASGKEPEAMSAELAALFPSEFEDSEQGSIPKGWSRLPVKALCSRVSNGATPSRSKPEFWGEGHGWFKTGELLDGFILKAKEEITPAGLAGSSAKIFPRHSVLMAIYAAPTVGRLGILTEPACFNQAATGMMPKDSVGPWFLYQALKHGRAWFNSRSNGAAQQNISKEIVENYQILTPNTAVLAGFNKVVGPCYQQMELNTVLCHTLSSLRDHLLPRLISGKLSLEEAERSIEEAVDA